MDSENQRMDTSHPSKIVLWAFSALTFGVTLFPNYGFTEGLSIFGVNISKTSDVVHKFRVDIQPSSSLYFVWTLIFAWQVAWLGYTSTLIFRRSRDGRLYYSPPFMRDSVYVFFIVASVLDFIWNILWGLQYVQFCLLINILLIGSLMVSLCSSFYGLTNHGQDLINEGKSKDVYCTILLVQYGLGVYAWQVFVYTLINLSAVLTYYFNISHATSGAVSLSVLMVTMTVWFMLDNFFFEEYCRYFFVPYVVVTYFLAGSLKHNWKVYNLSKPSIDSVFTAVLLALLCVAFVLKVIIVILKSKKKPLFDWNGNVSEINIVQSEITPLMQD